jgi:hypothetical protein
MKSIFNKLSSKIVILLIIAGMIVIGASYEPEKVIDKVYIGHVLNEQAEEIKTIEVEFDGVYNNDLDQFTGTIVIDYVKLKNIIAKNNGVVYTEDGELGKPHEYGDIKFSRKFDSIDFQLYDRKITHTLFKNIKWDEVVSIVITEEA